MKYYEDILDSVLDPVGESGGGKDIIYRCPFCEGTRGSGHLYINYNKNMYHCYKCGIGGRDIKYLLMSLGISCNEEIPESIFEKKSTSVKLTDLLSKKIDEPKKRDLNKITRFFYEHTIELTSGAIDYLHKRNVSDEEISVYNIREGINKLGSLVCGEKGQNYQGRILVPSMIGKEVSYFVARDYVNPNNKRKYLNPPSTIAYSSEDVWNLSLARSVSSTVIICEGVFTAIAAGKGKYNAVATYGKSIADVSNRGYNELSQGVQLLNAKFDRYIVAYDADARKELIDTCEYLYERGANTYFVLVPDKYGTHTDISDLSRGEYLDLLKNMRKYNTQSKLELIQ